MGCPSENSLAAFIDGLLDERESAGLRGHVEACAACQRLVAALDSGAAVAAVASGSSASLDPLLDELARAETASAREGSGADSGREPRAGSLIGGRYRLQEFLGAGGMGTVWAAEHIVSHERFALKLIRHNQAQRPSMRKRMLREARAASAVNHPNVVRVLDVFEAEDGTPVLVMDLLDGETLRERLRREGRLALGETARLLSPALSAIACAHAAGVIHRDLKPDNLFLVRRADGGSEVRVVDFGLARLIAVDATSSQLTHSGEMLGTPSYMSPEQSFGETDLDARTDVWAMGVILYECLAGKRPFDGGNFGQVFKRITSGQRPPLRTESPGLPADVLALVDRLLTVAKAERPGDFTEAIRVLTGYAESRGASGQRRPEGGIDSRRPASRQVLLLAPLTQATSTSATARRLAAHLRSQHAVQVVDATTATSASLRQLVAEHRIEVAIGVGARQGGALLRELGLPYALVLDGPDLYEASDAGQPDGLDAAVAGAARLVAFSEENRARAGWRWPQRGLSIECIAAGVAAELTSESDTEAGGAAPAAFSLRALLGLPATSKVALLPSGIRRSKDPLHVVEAFSRLHETQPDMHLVVTGPVADEDAATDTLEALRDLPGVHFVGLLPRAQLLAAMGQATVVLNTSLSEGMSRTILEAMSLGTPVIARRNAGNEALVAHGHTGLLYDEPRELCEWFAGICGFGDLGARLAAAARARVEVDHGESVERERYLALVQALGQPPPPPARLEPATAIDDGLDVALTQAARLGFRAEIREALAALVTEARARPELGRTLYQLGAQLASAPPSAALAEVADRCLEASLGKLRARTAFLALALAQVPSAEARLLARGVDAEMIRATLSDLVDWTHHLYAQGAGPGLTLELLAWAQHYLRGELLRVGPLQFELRPFAPPIRVYRHRSTHHLSAVTVDGRPVDLARGTVLDEPPPLHGEEWALALAPGTPVLQMWIPGSATLIDLREVTRTMRAAEALFERLAAETAPVGVIGESWRLDPQVLRFMPSTAGVQDLQLACQLLPSTLGEAQTLRRLFGPDVTRGDLAGLDATRLSPAHRAIVEFLKDGRNELRARLGFVLREELSRMPVWG